VKFSISQEFSATRKKKGFVVIPGKEFLILSQIVSVERIMSAAVCSSINFHKDENFRSD